MTYEYYETSALAYILEKPNKYSLVKSSYFKYEVFKEIFAIIPKISKDIKISRKILYDYCKINDMYITDTQLDLLYQEEYGIRKEIFEIALKQLRERERKDIIVNELEKSIELIQTGYEVEGITRAKNIKYSEPKKLLGTISLMCESLKNSSGFKTGIDSIDINMSGLLLGNLMTIFGDTGSMKTMISMWLCIKILEKNPTYKCLYFEKEMSERDLARRLVAYFCNISMRELINESTFADRKNQFGALISEMTKEYNDILMRLTIVPSSHISDARSIYEYIDSYSPQVWCLDFITLLGDESGRENNFYMYISEQLRQIKNISINTNSLGILISQLNKGTVEKRSNRIPIKDDCEWGTKLKQFSAYMFATFYPTLYYTNLHIDGENFNENYFYLIGEKNRNDKNVNIYLKANPSYCKFEEVDIFLEQRMISWLDGYKSKKKGE